MAHVPVFLYLFFTKTYIHMARVPVEREVVKVWNANHLKVQTKLEHSKRVYNEKMKIQKKSAITSISASRLYERST